MSLDFVFEIPKNGIFVYAVSVCVFFLFFVFSCMDFKKIKLRHNFGTEIGEFPLSGETPEDRLLCLEVTKRNQKTSKIVQFLNCKRVYI